MANRILRMGIKLCFILAILLGQSGALAQEGTSEPGRVRYFSSTQHTLTGEFLTFYESIPNPELVYGNPITEAFQNQLNGRLVQYFEHTRFELFPDNPPELRVYITRLGEIFYTESTELPTQGSVPGCRHFSESGKFVCYAFLEFFDAHGGAAQFGYPISNFEIHEQRIVQYFSRGRFEWHPELPTGQRVQLTDLGRSYFDLIGEDPRLLEPKETLLGDALPRPVVHQLKLYAFLRVPVSHPNGSQTITVIVQDQNLRPVEKAAITMVITLPSGEKLALNPPVQSDKNGILSYSFTFEKQPVGPVRIDVDASYETIRKSTVTSFLIWH